MSKLGIYINQEFAFLDLMMRGKKSPSVFFPGCAFMKFGKETIYKTLDLLKKYDKDVEVCSLCCSRPSQVLDRNFQNKNISKLVKYFLNSGIKKIYLACPNCYDSLKKIFNDNSINIELVMIYKVLLDCIKNDKNFNTISEKVVLHDPCSIRNDSETQDSVRKILKFIGQEYIEPDFTRENTLCCGNKNMLHVVSPTESKIILKRRLEDLTKKSRIICSYCNGCLSSFSKEKVQVVHLIELILGKAKSNSFLNRVNFTLGLKKC